MVVRRVQPGHPRKDARLGRAVLAKGLQRRGLPGDEENVVAEAEAQQSLDSEVLDSDLEPLEEAKQVPHAERRARRGVGAQQKDCG